MSIESQLLKRCLN